MKEQTFGSMLAAMRKERGMTQLELAEKMGVTDKAVSKWERDLSFPDIVSIPKLAEIFDVTADELIQIKSSAKKSLTDNKSAKIVNLALKGVALAMGIAVTVLMILNELETNSALCLLGIGLSCLAISQFSAKNE